MYVHELYMNSTGRLVVIINGALLLIQRLPKKKGQKRLEHERLQRWSEEMQEKARSNARQRERVCRGVWGCVCLEGEGSVQGGCGKRERTRRKKKRQRQSARERAERARERARQRGRAGKQKRESKSERPLSNPWADQEQRLVSQKLGNPCRCLLLLFHPVPPLLRLLPFLLLLLPPPLLYCSLLQQHLALQPLLPQRAMPVSYPLPINIYIYICVYIYKNI